MVYLSSAPFATGALLCNRERKGIHLLPRYLLFIKRVRELDRAKGIYQGLTKIGRSGQSTAENDRLQL